MLRNKEQNCADKLQYNVIQINEVRSINKIRFTKLLRDIIIFKLKFEYLNYRLMINQQHQ